MTERWVGLVVSGAGVTLVDAEVPEDGPIVIQQDQTMRLPTGPRERAYHLIYQQCSNYLRENEIRKVVVMASALTGRGGGGLAHLESAELRGAVTAAAASVCPTQLLGKAAVSKSYGERKAAEYIEDEVFWDSQLEGKVRKTSRMAALLLLAARAAA